MKLIKTPRLRLAQLQTFTESIIEICIPIPSLAPTLSKITGILNAFKEGMVKGQASAEEKQILDYQRDKLNSGFLTAIDGESNFPHEDEAVKEALAALIETVDKYGFEINRLTNNEETAQIDNMLTDISEINLEPLTSTGILRWIPLIMDANENYKNASGDYNTDRAELASIDAASKLVPELRNSLNGLFSMLYASILLEPTDELNKAYTEIEALVKSSK